MAFNYENPHDDPNLGNYDFYVMEVKEFNRKLDEYQEEVNRKLADQDEEIVNFKTVVNGQINQLRGQLANFEESIRNWQDGIEEQYQEEYNALVEQVNRIIANMREYVWAYMAEEGESLIAGGQVVFTCRAHGVGEPITVTTDVAVTDLVTLINNNKFQPLVTYIDGGKSRFVPDDWEVNISNGNNLLIYIYGSTYGNSVIGNKRFKITYQAINGSIVNNVFEIVGSIYTNGMILRTITKSKAIAAKSSDYITFDNVSLDGYTGYAIVEYGQIYQNQKWVGGQFVDSPMCLPYLLDESDNNNISLKMRCYNPNTSGAVDITAYAKVLLTMNS